MLSMELGELIGAVQRSDLAAEEARYKADRDVRRALRAESESQGLNTSELVRELAGVDEGKSDEVLQVKKTQESSDAQKPKPTGFPPPPNSAASVGR